MLRLTARRRPVLVETFRELANLAVAALVLGQIVKEPPVSPWFFAAGAAAWIVFVMIALSLAGENGRD